MGFLESATADHVQNTNTNLNNTLTQLGGADNLRQARDWQAISQAPRPEPWWRLPSPTSTEVVEQAANASPALSSTSTALGHAGGALALLGAGNDIHTMMQDGVGAGDGEVATSLLGNTLGVGSWALGMAGSTVAAPALAAGSAGVGLGMMSNDFISDTGLLGDTDQVDEYGDPVGRSWSDMAADWGTNVQRSLGDGVGADVMGGLATLGGSLVGTAGTILTSPLVAADAVGDLVGGLGNSIARTIVPNPARRADREARSHLRGRERRQQRRHDRRQRRQDRQDVRVATGRGRGNRLLGLGNGTR